MLTYGKRTAMWPILAVGGWLAFAALPTLLAVFCAIEDAQPPLQLSDDLALLAGDVNMENSQVGFLTPSTASPDMNDDCAPMPLTMFTTETADSQFIVIPVAVVGDDLTPDGSVTIVDVDGDVTYPRLVSTIQLIHVESGRLLGTRTCLNQLQGCSTRAPVLLPKIFTAPCSLVLGDFNSVWDLDAHDVPANRVDEVLKNKAGIDYSQTTTGSKINNIPVAYPNDKNTVQTGIGFNIFSSKNPDSQNFPEEGKEFRQNVLAKGKVQSHVQNSEFDGNNEENPEAPSELLSFFHIPSLGQLQITPAKATSNIGIVENRYSGSSAGKAEASVRQAATVEAESETKAEPNAAAKTEVVSTSVMSAAAAEDYESQLWSMSDEELSAYLATREGQMDMLRYLSGGTHEDVRELLGSIEKDGETAEEVLSGGAETGTGRGSVGWRTGASDARGGAGSAQGNETEMIGGEGCIGGNGDGTARTQERWSGESNDRRKDPYHFTINNSVLQDESGISATSAFFRDVLVDAQGHSRWLPAPLPQCDVTDTHTQDVLDNSMNSCGNTSTTYNYNSVGNTHTGAHAHTTTATSRHTSVPVASNLPQPPPMRTHLAQRMHSSPYRTLSIAESRAVATELLESERWMSLEPAYSAPEARESDVWNRIHRPRYDAYRVRTAKLLQLHADMVNGPRHAKDDVGGQSLHDMGEENRKAKSVRVFGEDIDGSVADDGYETNSDTSSGSGADIGDGEHYSTNSHIDIVDGSSPSPTQHVWSHNMASTDTTHPRATLSSSTSVSRAPPSPPSPLSTASSSLSLLHSSSDKRHINMTNDYILSTRALLRGMKAEEVQEVLMWAALASIDAQLYRNISLEEIDRLVPENKIPDWLQSIGKSGKDAKNDLASNNANHATPERKDNSGNILNNSRLKMLMHKDLSDFKKRLDKMIAKQHLVVLDKMTKKDAKAQRVGNSRNSVEHSSEDPPKPILRDSILTSSSPEASSDGSSGSASSVFGDDITVQRAEAAERAGVGQWTQAQHQRAAAETASAVIGQLEARDRLLMVKYMLWEQLKAIRAERKMDTVKEKSWVKGKKDKETHAGLLRKRNKKMGKYPEKEFRDLEKFLEAYIPEGQPPKENENSGNAITSTASNDTSQAATQATNVASAAPVQGGLSSAQLQLLQRVLTAAHAAESHTQPVNVALHSTDTPFNPPLSEVASPRESSNAPASQRNASVEQRGSASRELKSKAVPNTVLQNTPSATNASSSAIPMLPELLSQVDNRGFGAIMSGISGVGISNIFSGTTADTGISSVSLGDFASSAASWVTDNMVSMDLSSRMANDEAMQSRQAELLSRELANIQRRNVGRQSGLSSVTNANHYVNNTAFISLRTRPLSAGPMELIRPCSSYVTENIAPTDVEKVLQRDGTYAAQPFHNSGKRKNGIFGNSGKHRHLYRYNPEKYGKRTLATNRLQHLPEEADISFRNDDGEVVRARAGGVHRPVITYTGRIKPENIKHHNKIIDPTKLSLGPQQYRRSDSQDEDLPDVPDLLVEDVEYDVNSVHFERKEGLQTRVRKGNTMSGKNRIPKQRKRTNLARYKKMTQFGIRKPNSDSGKGKNRESNTFPKKPSPWSLGHRLASIYNHPSLAYMGTEHITSGFTTSAYTGEGVSSSQTGNHEELRENMEIPKVSRPYSTLASRRFDYSHPPPSGPHTYVDTHAYASRHVPAHHITESASSSSSSAHQPPSLFSSSMKARNGRQRGNSDKNKPIFSRPGFPGDGSAPHLSAQRPVTVMHGGERVAVDMRDEHVYKVFQTISESSRPCVLRAVPLNDGSGDSVVECVPVSDTASTPLPLADESLWAMTRVPFTEVPASALYLSESMTNLNYDMDYASLNTIPYFLGQMVLRNFSPFEQFLTVKAAKRLFRSQTFTFAIEFRPVVVLVIDEFPNLFAPAQAILNALLAPVIAFLDMIFPGIGALIPPLAGTGGFGLNNILLGFEIPIGFRIAHTHTEDMEVVVSYSLTAPPQTNIVGRAVANIGWSQMPFTMDVTRSVHVPAGVYGQTTGQLISFDYRVPGIYDNANLVNSEFIVDSV